MWGAFHDQFFDDIEYGGGGEQMVEDVHIGNNVVVKWQTNTNEDYWIFLCDKGLHVVEECFIDGRRQEWFPSD